MSKKYDEMRKAAMKKGALAPQSPEEMQAKVEAIAGRTPEESAEARRGWQKSSKPGKKPRPDRSAAGRDARVNARGRLPGFSQVVAAYDAEAGVWKGSLSVPYESPGLGHSWEQFRHEADGLFRLMEELDGQYRAWLAEREKNK